MTKEFNNILATSISKKKTVRNLFYDLLNEGDFKWKYALSIMKLYILNFNVNKKKSTKKT